MIIKSRHTVMEDSADLWRFWLLVDCYECISCVLLACCTKIATTKMVCKRVFFQILSDELFTSAYSARPMTMLHATLITRLTANFSISVFSSVNRAPSVHMSSTMLNTQKYLYFGLNSVSYSVIHSLDASSSILILEFI